MRRDVFQAIADPNRRAILSLLARQPLPLGRVAENFKISRPAISRHMRILTECGLVYVRRQGRQRFCEVRLEKLDEVTTWIDHSRKLWEARLDRLNEYLGELQSK